MSISVRGIPGEFHILFTLEDGCHAMHVDVDFLQLFMRLHLDGLIPFENRSQNRGHLGDEVVEECVILP